MCKHNWTKFQQGIAWKKCYMKCSVWNQLKIWSSHLLDNLSNCHEPEKLRWLNGIRTHDLCDCLRHMEIVLWKVALSGRIELLLSFFKPLIHVHALSPVFEDKDSHSLASRDIGILKYIKHVVFVSTIVKKHDIICLEKISFLCQKRFHYFGLLLFKNAVLQH